MKKSFIIFNDAHLKTGNEQDVIRSARHMIKYAINNSIDKIVFAGDLFDSRTFQRQSVLKAFDYILNLFNENNITLYIIPGNHDKTKYDSYESFLDIYRYYPCVKFYDKLSVVEINGISVTLLPFFTDEMLVPMIEESSGSDILISHFEMQGSSHLGHVSEKTTLTKNMFKKWKKVYLGHYHNHNEITEDIVHLPSMRQSNFGEDDNKGFSVIYEDLSYEIIKGDFTPYLKIRINIDETSSTEINRLITTHKDSESVVRFEFTGSESKLKAIDKSKFKGTGINVLIKYDSKYNFDESDSKMPTIKDSYGEENIKLEFKEFCSEKNYDYKRGEELLKEFLNKKENA